MKAVKHFFSFTTRVTFFACLFFVIFAVLIAVYIKKQELAIGDRIYPNIFINEYNASYKPPPEVQDYFRRKNNDLRKTIVYLYYDSQEATFSGQLLQIAYDTDIPIHQAYSVGRLGLLTTKVYQKLVTIFGLGQYQFKAPLEYNTSVLKEYLADLDFRYSHPPEDALFQFEKGRVIAFKVEKKGVKVDVEKGLRDIDNAIKSLQNKKVSTLTIQVTNTISKPQVTLASINDLGIEEEIGRGMSDYSGSIPGRIHNVILASSKFNGVVIPKGQIFSFNQTVGDISADTGYEQAYIIKNGQTVLGDGGGVCQVSTTLFRAALNIGLPIIKRSAHAYRVHYYENDRKPGFDATVFAPSVDFRIKNDTPAAILIQTEIDKVNKKLTFVLYGKKDNRKVYVSNVTLWDFQPAPPARYQDDPTLKVGTTKQVDWSAPGTKSKFHYKVVKDGEVTQNRDFLSNYRPWQAAYLVGTMP